MTKKVRLIKIIDVSLVAIIINMLAINVLDIFIHNKFNMKFPKSHLIYLTIFGIIYTSFIILKKHEEKEDEKASK